MNGGGGTPNFEQLHRRRLRPRMTNPNATHDRGLLWRLDKHIDHCPQCGAWRWRQHCRTCPKEEAN